MGNQHQEFPSGFDPNNYIEIQANIITCPILKKSLDRAITDSDITKNCHACGEFSSVILFEGKTYIRKDSSCITGSPPIIRNKNS